MMLLTRLWKTFKNLFDYFNGLKMKLQRLRRNMCLISASVQFKTKKKRLLDFYIKSHIALILFHSTQHWIFIEHLLKNNNIVCSGEFYTKKCLPLLNNFFLKATIPEKRVWLQDNFFFSKEISLSNARYKILSQNTEKSKKPQ